MLQKYSLFSKDHEVLLNYPDFEEKKKILNSHLTKSSDENTNHLSCATKQHIDKSPRPKLTEKKLNELLSACTSSVGFPSVCWMYINIPECTKEGDAFFLACEYKLAKIIASMKNPLKCCLHYAMLQRKCFVDTNSLDQKCLKELREIFRYKEMTENSIQDCFEKERNYFSVGQNPGIYKFSQNVLYEQCLKERIGEGRRDRFLLLCNIEQVKEIIRDENYKVVSSDVILRLKESEYAEFAPKFASLWKVHEELKHHPLLQNEIFRKDVDEECAKQQMEEDLTHENETGVIPSQSLSDGEIKSKGSEDTCTWKSKQPMQASPQLTLDEKEQEDSPLLNEMSV
ncbi:hypothetical protein FSP39_004467 [Pinctada imbricata]|uniref:Uncharacterized protein n=1 Tax=Pinctada imbricata TaxID=66713 RepID=A0AA88YB13_PINIB|nr:hypothetical protein FSP39_004467 [Pinctada imbricata]